MIVLKKSLSKWVKVSKDDTVEFLIDYPTIKQGEHLDELKYDALGKYFNEDLKIDLAKFLKYKRYYLKYVIKDWKGLGDKCELKDGELTDELWTALTRDENQVNLLYELIAELDFDNSDKKK